MILEVSVYSGDRVKFNLFDVNKQKNAHGNGPKRNPN